MPFGPDWNPLSAPFPTGGQDALVHGTVPKPEQSDKGAQTNLVTHEAVANTIAVDDNIELGEN